MLSVGISACLVADQLRYDGRDKKNPSLLALSGCRVNYVPFCPEVGCGMSVPREPMQLEGDPQEPRLITVTTRQDKTDLIKIWSKKQISGLEQKNLSGFIFKNRSPSCGLSKVPVTISSSGPARSRVVGGIGLFAMEVKKHFPQMPMVEEDDLSSYAAIDNFLEMVRVFRDLSSVNGRDDSA
ncbi:MAG: DUF523 domain-containing protein [Magnetococcales bacterium]|nr:DUF523 domain-containing protein [Magnetococcales bacterium]